MQSMDRIEDTKVTLAEIARSDEDTAAVRNHVAEIIEGKEFRGSPRSQQFLRYVVEEAIAGHVESLKERVIGAELFGRPPAYETGEDAIVRVTASDVRKRLLQYYDIHGATSEFRICIPLGSYVPAIVRARGNGTGVTYSAEGGRQLAAAPQVLEASHQDSASALHGLAIASPSVPQSAMTPPPRRSWLLPLVAGILLVALNLALWAIYWSRPSRTEARPIPVLPWSAIFNSPHSVQLITSDPNMPEIERFTGGQITVSDYANHNYLSGPNKLNSEEMLFCGTVLNGSKASSDDVPIIANIAQLAQASSRKIDVHAAREIQLHDLRTDDNFIFLGSPRSDPWTTLFDDQLDFKFVFDKATQSEFIVNVNPHANERPAYIPTARGSLSGDTFAIIALVQNPDQDGQVLLLAGATAEGTAAAGKLVTDKARLFPVLQKCGIYLSGPVQHFELLLHLDSFGGSPSHIDVEACHVLPGNSPHKS
jgi:hypothetical protein